MQAGSKAYQLAWWLGIAHGLNDFLAGYYLAHLQGNLPGSQAFLVYIVYVVLAFGGQAPAGWWIDRSKWTRQVSLLCVVGLAALCLMSQAQPLFIIALSGVISAFLHVCGGAATLDLQRGKSVYTGIFAAPGVIGLAAGAWMGATGGMALIYILPLAILLLSVFPFLQWSGRRSDQDMQGSPIIPKLDNHDIIMMLLLLALTLRSVLWNTVQLAYHGEYIGLLWIAGAACIGKWTGGRLADLLGWKPYLFGSLGLAAALLAVFPNALWAVAFGTASMQSTIPATLVLLRETMPERPALAAGLCFGATVLLAGLPFVWLPGISVVGWQFLLGILVLAGCYVLIRKSVPLTMG
jgi:MFS transporter, FSR family, fosmidomycin resistance protein